MQPNLCCLLRKRRLRHRSASSSTRLQPPAALMSCCRKRWQDGAVSTPKRPTGRLNYRWTENLFLSGSVLLLEQRWSECSTEAEGISFPTTLRAAPSLSFQAGPLPLHGALFTCYTLPVSPSRSVVQHLVLSIVFNVFVSMFVQAGGSSWSIWET